MCEAAWGYCKWTDDGVGCANGKFLIGKCAGPENRKCCVRDGKSGSSGRRGERLKLSVSVCLDRSSRPFRKLVNRRQSSII